MSKKTTKNTHGGLKILATAAAIAAGGYFLYGKDAAKNRKRVKGWMLKVKGEVLDEIEKLKEIDEERYHKIVDNVVGKYKMAKDACHIHSPPLYHTAANPRGKQKSAALYPRGACCFCANRNDI